jgi:hypothetical protein
MKRRRYTEKEMLHAYAEWRKSGLSKKDYCQRAQIGYSTFFNRTKNFGDLSEDRGFLRVDHLFQKFDLAPEMEMEFPSGVKIRFYRPIDAHFVKSLV